MNLANQGTVLFLSLLNDEYGLIFYRGTSCLQIDKVNGQFIVSENPAYDDDQSFWSHETFQDWIPVKLRILQFEPLEVEIS